MEGQKENRLVCAECQERFREWQNQGCSCHDHSPQKNPISGGLRVTSGVSFNEKPLDASGAGGPSSQTVP